MEVLQVINYFENYWIITTRKTAYALGIASNGHLQHLYWGEKLPFREDYPGLGRPRPNYPGFNFSEEAIELQKNGGLAGDEFPAWGGFLYTEPALKVTFPGGIRDLDLKYQNYRLDRSREGLPELIITLQDKIFSLEVDLVYKVVEECDLIERRVQVKNRGAQAFELEAVLSACWHLPALTTGDYRLTHLAGRWNADTRINRSVLAPGKTVLESRRGMTSAEANPYFAIDVFEPEGGGASEDTGQVWYGALGWSGNWKISLEKSGSPVRLQVLGGINDFDFKWKLNPGETFETPAFIGGYTPGGFGQASRNLHRFQLDYSLPRAHAHKLRKVLYNSWEAVFFEVNEEKQIQLAQRAASLGVELFVIDDGWFGERHHDRAGLGDWYVNPTKFPRGLNPLVKRVNELGMDFGIWVEPEMVNPESELYRNHPDWVYHFPNRDRGLFRQQLLLNLAKSEVAEHIFGWLDDLLTGHNITFVKWDFNRPISEPGWPDAPLERQREVYVRHVQALYNIVDRLREKHPQVVWEACASGGARVDLGILQHFDQTWPSDNTDPFDRLFIQEGYSMVYTPKTMTAWASGSPSSRQINNPVLSLRYRFHSAMTGSLGLGEDLNHYTEEEMKEAAERVAEYKVIRPLVQEGLLYRLVSPRSGEFAALQYTSQDQNEAVVFAFLHSQHYWQSAPRIYLRGLDPLKRYLIEGLEDEKGPVSGQSLMSAGLRPKLIGHFASQIIKLKSI